jgi:hypothetical protein
MALSEFDHWVAQNNIPEQFAYGKGWWEYVELIRRFAHKFEIADVRVVGHYVVRTPPPEEELPMPAVTLAKTGVEVSLKWDFGTASLWPREWTASIRRRSPYAGPTFNLFDPELDLRAERVEGFGPELVFGPYRENPARFTCELVDAWDVATLLRLVLHEP